MTVFKSSFFPCFLRFCLHLVFKTLFILPRAALRSPVDPLDSFPPFFGVFTPFTCSCVLSGLTNPFVGNARAVCLLCAPVINRLTARSSTCIKRCPSDCCFGAAWSSLGASSQCAAFSIAPVGSGVCGRCGCQCAPRARGAVAPVQCSFRVAARSGHRVCGAAPVRQWSACPVCCAALRLPRVACARHVHVVLAMHRSNAARFRVLARVREMLCAGKGKSQSASPVPRGLNGVW